MQRKKLRSTKGFHVAIGNRNSQAAEMVLTLGQTEGGPDNSHRGSDQWMYVVSGTGVAKVGRRKCKLEAGVVLLIERGEAHEIMNTGTTALRTVNFYVPPAYRPDGSPLPRGKS